MIVRSNRRAFEHARNLHPDGYTPCVAYPEETPPTKEVFTQRFKERMEQGRREYESSRGRKK